MYRHIAPLITGILVGAAIWLVDAVLFAFTNLETSMLGALFTAVSPLRIGVRLLLLLIAIFFGGLKCYTNQQEEIKALGLGDPDEIFADEHQARRAHSHLSPENQLSGDDAVRGASYIEKVEKNPNRSLASQPARYNRHTKKLLAKKTKALQDKNSLAYSIFKENQAPGQDECQQVWQYAGKLGEVLNLSLKDLEAIRTLCYCHNLGRFAADDQNQDHHPELSARIIEDIPVLQNATELIRMHHERWDGSGIYGLAGLEIPLGSRIFAVAWVFNSLTKNNGGWRLSNDEALEALYMYSDTALDPELVATFIGMMGKGRLLVDNTIKQTAFSR